MRARLAIIAACLTGCGLFSDPPYLVTKLQVIAVVAEPPEVAPDQTAELWGVVADPQRVAPSIVATWSYCQQHDQWQNATLCHDAAVLPPETQDQPLANVLITRAQHAVPSLEMSTLPPTILEAGFWEFVRIAAHSDDDAADALKRVVVSTSEVPNTNPVLSEVQLWRDGAQLAAPARIDAGDEVALVPIYNADDFTTYRVLGQDGTWESRQERASFTWHVTGGELDRWTTSGEDRVVWTAPERNEVTNGRAQLFAVLRDGRGGTAVWVGEIEIR